MATKQPEASGLLMPKATAVWLVENTALSFDQIGEFTGLHAIEVQALADEEVGRGIVGRNPLEHGEITQEELDKAGADPSYRMRQSRSDLPSVKLRAKGPKYTPVSKRGDKPDAIAYLIKHHPEITEAQICRLIGTTKPTIASVRDRSHPGSQSIKPRHPVDLGLCTYGELEAAARKGLKAQGKNDEEIKAIREKAFENQEAEKEKPRAGKDITGGFDFTNFLNKNSGS
jgi:hypothetical protein